MSKKKTVVRARSASQRRRAAIQKEVAPDELTHACASCGNKTNENGLDQDRPAVCVKCRNASVEKIAV